MIPNYIDGDLCPDVPDLIRDLDGSRAPCPSRPRLGGRGMGRGFRSMQAGMRGNKLAITVFDSYAGIIDKCCIAGNFFANDRDAVTSITTRSWATVNL